MVALYTADPRYVAAFFFFLGVVFGHACTPRKLVVRTDG